MSFDPVDPERALMQIMKLDLERLKKEWVLDVSNYIFYGECGLAHDVFIFLMREGAYKPSDEALRLIKLTASMLGWVFKIELRAWIAMPNAPSQDTSKARRKSSSIYTPGRCGNTDATGVRNGVQILVHVSPSGRVVSGYPINLPRNP